MGGWNTLQNNGVLGYADSNFITSMVPTGWRNPTHFFIGRNWLNTSAEKLVGCQGVAE
jgi:hypothetical protein